MIGLGGVLGFLVNNAGIMRDRTFHEPDDERSNSELDVAFRTAFRATVAATPPTRESAKQETAGWGTSVYRKRATFTTSSAAIVCRRGVRCL